MELNICYYWTCNRYVLLHHNTNSLSFQMKVVQNMARLLIQHRFTRGKVCARAHTHRFGYISHLDINKICHFYEGVQFLLFWRHFETQILEYFIWLCYGEMLIFYYHIIYITGFTQKYTKKLKSKRCSYFRAVRENSMIAHLWFICDTASIYISYSLQNAFVFKQGFEQLHVTFQMNLKQLE